VILKVDSATCKNSSIAESGPLQKEVPISKDVQFFKKSTKVLFLKRNLLLRIVNAM
jgi:hypothetical protein